jgi:urate oxidase
MAIVLGRNQYGKAETRVVRIYRDGPRHEIHDLNVTTSLRGDFAAAHLDGDQRNVLPTDSQKNTAFAFARQQGVDQIEDYALRLARHFADDVEPVRSARVTVHEYAWERATVDGREHDHTWVRKGQEVRVAEATVEGRGGEQRVQVVSGLDDLVLLKSTGSQFAGFLRDEYTTLAEAQDRVMATSLVARWRHSLASADWGTSYADVRRILIEQFATLHSLALQQTLWHMARAVLQAHPLLTEISLSAPNKHHFLVDLAPFGLDNPGEVYVAADRPYGLIEVTATRDEL